MIDTAQKLKNAINQGNLNFNKFWLLSETGKLLSNPSTIADGREIVIRILDKKEQFSDYSDLLKRLIRKSGLFPYLTSEFSDLNLEEQLTTDLYRPKGLEKEFVFHSLQQVVYKTIINGSNVVLSASTSVGKSAIVDSILASCKFDKIVIVVPTIALIDETRRRIIEKFNNLYQIITHPSQSLKATKVIYILTQERVNSREDLNNIDFFVLDEFYKLVISDDDDHRAIELNIALSKLIKKSKQFYLIGPNITEVLGLNNFNKRYVFIPDDFTTVAVNIEEYNLKSTDNSRLEKTIEILNTFPDTTLIYCQSPASVTNLLYGLIENDIKFESKVERKFIDWISENYIKDWVVIKALERGIGIHHGNLPRAIQQKMIQLFNSKSINVLLCTSTIIEGVNSSAKNVIIYDRRDGNSVVSHFTHKNIQGRAGRMTKHFVGNVFCLEQIPEKNEFDTRVIIESGIQSGEAPINLLYGIENDYLKDNSIQRLNQFNQSSILPIEIFRKNSKYFPKLLEEVYAKFKDSDDIESYCWTGVPTTNEIKELCELLYILEKKSLDRCNLGNTDSLSVFITQYLNADSYSGFIKGKMEYYKYQDKLSDTLDWILKVLRNIIGFNIPRAISAVSDILDYEVKRRGLRHKHNYGFVIHRMENYHLQSSLAAIDEFGIPIQVAEKFSYKDFEENDVDFVINFIKQNYKRVVSEGSVEEQFIKDALQI